MNEFNSNKVRELCEAKDISLKKLAADIGLSQTGLQGIFKNNSTSIATLQKISKYFNVPIYHFFSQSNEIASQTNSIHSKGQVIDPDLDILEELSKIKIIAALLMIDSNEVSISKSLSIAVQLHRNIILQDALLPGRTEVPGVLERVAMELGASVDGDSIKGKLSAIDFSIRKL